MKNFISFRLFTVAAISVLIPPLAQAHPGHGGGEGAGHELGHVGLGLAALLVTVGIGFAANKLQAHARSHFTAQRKPTPAGAEIERLAQEGGG